MGAMNARFTVDFAAFYDACTKAEVKLADLNAGANKVGTALDKMVTSFSGKKVIQEALLMEKALGGVENLSKLTQEELRRVSTTAGAAIEKMKLLGSAVPPELQKLYDATKPIPKELQKIAETAQPIPSLFSKMTSALGPLGPLVAGAFSVGAVVSFGKGLLTTGDELVKLRDKTGISVEGLQRLRAVAGESGNTLDQLTGAVSQMQNRLAGGDKSAAAAADRLGLSLSKLRASSPEQQFNAIASAIATVEDPAQRAADAMDLFGKSGAEILPSLLADIDKIGGATRTMSEATAEALDAAGDAWDTFVRDAKVVAGEFIGGLVQWNQRVDEEMRAIANRQFGPTVGTGLFRPVPIPEALAALGLPSQADLDDLDKKIVAVQNRAAEAAERNAEKAKATAEKAAEAFAILLGKVRALEGGLFQVSPALQSIGRAYDDSQLGDIAEDFERIQQVIERIQQDARQLAFDGLRGITKELQALGEQSKVTMGDLDWMNTFVGPVQDLADKMRQVEEKAASMGQVLKGIPDTLIAAFTGGGGVIGALQAIAVQFGNSFADTLRLTIATNLDAKGTGLTAGGLKAAGGLGAVTGLGAGASGATLNQGLGTVGMAGASVAVGALTSGATLSAAVALGAATFGIGAAAVVAYVAVKKLLNDPEKKVNPIRQSFVDAAGGLEALNKRAVEAGVTLTRMLDAKTPQAYEAAIRDLNKALEFQDSAMQMLDEAVKKYGFSMAQLGPTLSKQKLNEQAAQLITDFRLLEKAGIDVNHISTQMSSSINEYLQNALKTGNAVPEAMREILNQLATMGLLTDENGVLISDLEDAGVTFAKTLEGQFESLITTIQKLTDAIARGLGLAIENVPDMDLTVNRHYRDDEDAGGEGGEDFAGAAHGMAKGGYGRVLRPTLFLAGEAGAENFAFWKPGASRGGGNTVNVGDVVVQGQFGSEAEFGREVAKASIQRARRMGVRFSGR